jgi:hypothetical protein
VEKNVALNSKEYSKLRWIMAIVQPIAVAALVTGCAKDATQVGATYVSPILYDNYTCPQLAEEAQRVSLHAAEAAGVQDQKATNDKVAMGVGPIVFWPALFLTKGNDENTAELARLKGQMDAIEETSIKRKCGITFQHASQQRQAFVPDTTQTH